MGMPNAKKHQPMNNEEHNKDAKTNDNPDSFKVVSVNSMTFHVFFDGTGNNMFNTEHRLKDNERVDEALKGLPKDATAREKLITKKETRDKNPYKYLENELSYGNDLSNPAILYKAAEDNNSNIRRIYIEGAGTIRDQVDDTPGLAAGAGPSGIMARVYDAYLQISLAIKANKTKANTLVFNVFGFSRGSFYGRYFVALLKQDPETADPVNKEVEEFYERDKYNRLKIDWLGVDVPIFSNDTKSQANGRSLLKDYDPKKIIVNFVGIYDTVASHGWDHHNDSFDFYLDIGNKQSIKKLVHITAQDEYRNHFALVDTNTAISQKNSETGNPTGFRCSLPGAHADIGGGYIKQCKEEDIYLSNYDWDKYIGAWGEIHWQWYQDKGYYTSDPEKYKQIRYQQERFSNMPEKTPEEIQEKEKASIAFKRDINQLPTDNAVTREEKQQGELTFVNAWTRYEVRANRIVKGNAYQYIPLELMYKITTHPKINAVKFNNKIGIKAMSQNFVEVLQDPILKKFRDYVIKQGLAQFITEPEAVFSFENAGLTRHEIQYLYHEYIHNQLRASLDSLGGQISDKGIGTYIFGNWRDYLTNGSRAYNKQEDGYTPRRVIVLDNNVGVEKNT